MPGVLPKRSRYRLAAAWFSASWSRTLASSCWLKSPPTIGTELIAATGGTRRQRREAIRPRRAASCNGRSSTEAGKTSATCLAISCSVADVPREPRVRLDRDRTRGGQRLVVDDLGREPLAVTLLRELASELVHEQAPVSEDQDTDRAGRLDEAGGGD